MERQSSDHVTESPTDDQVGAGIDGAAPAKVSKPGTIVFTLMVAVFVSLLDAQVTATALPRIIADLGGFDSFAWITTGFIIAGSAVVPIYGKLGDQLGRKGVFIAAIVIFLLGSIACGLAQTMTQLIVFRVLQGIGSGGLFISVLAIIGEMFSPREGARYYGWFAITFGAASVAGPPLGALLTEFANWRWVFFVNLPIGLAVLLVVILVLRLPARTERARIDFLGVTLLVLIIVGLNLVVSWAGVRYSWGSPQILGLAVGSVVALGLFILSQRRAADPVIPLRLFRNSTFSIVVAINFIAGFVGLGIVNYLVLWLQAVLSVSIQVSGYVLTAMMLGVVLTSYLTTKLVARSGSYRWYPALSMGLFAVTAALFAMADASTSLPIIVVYMLLFGAAGGLNSQALSLAARNTTTYQDIGATQGVATTLRQMGTALGVSFFAAMMTGRLTAALSQRLGDTLGHSVDGSGTLSPAVLAKLSPQARLDVASAYADALQPVFLSVIPLVLIGLSVSLFLKDITLADGQRPAAASQDA